VEPAGLTNNLLDRRCHPSGNSTTGRRWPRRARTHEPAQFNLQHMCVQEQEGIECLVLRAGRDAFRESQVRKKLLDFDRVQRARVPLVVKQDETARSTRITIFSMRRIVADVEPVTRLNDHVRRPGLWQLPEIAAHDFAMQKQRGRGLRQRHARRRSRFHNVCAEMYYFGQTHLIGKPLIVEQNKGTARGHEHFGGRGRVPAADRGAAQLFEQRHGRPLDGTEINVH
jgi:hypothetical protein